MIERPALAGCAGQHLTRRVGNGNTAVQMLAGAGVTITIYEIAFESRQTGFVVRAIAKSIAAGSDQSREALRILEEEKKLRVGADLSEGQYAFNFCAPTARGCVLSVGKNVRGQAFKGRRSGQIFPLQFEGSTFEIDEEGNAIFSPSSPLRFVHRKKTSQNEHGSEDCDFTTASPLILDLNNRSIALSAPEKGVLFDIDGDGEQERISWPTRESSVFLTLDRNRNGKIDSVAELFGDGTLGPDGKHAANGFEALFKYDANEDARIDRSDPIFALLLIWSAPVKEGMVLKQTLRSLSSAGIRAIDLNYVEMFEVDDFGNETRQRSTVRMGDGKLRKIFDLWFAVP